MCLAVPMRILAIDGLIARCEAKGVQRSVNLILLDPQLLAPGIVVMVHAGHAIQTMSEDEARESWNLIDEMLAEEEKLAAEQTMPDAAEDAPQHLHKESSDA
ncbi:MAG: HypC/HybG/HupF family hydrogenase formation chaperone [Hyphomicrobium sp.]